MNEQIVVKDTHELHEDDHEACSHDWYDKDIDSDYLSSGAYVEPPLTTISGKIHIQRHLLL